MKKSLKTQLLAAIAMVLVASIALGSSTYAWFSMNNQVTATGMKVSAKNDSGSLIIAATTYSGTTPTTPDLAGAQTANLTSVELSSAQYNYTTDFSVKPVQHEVKSTIADLDSVANWSYKVAASPSSYAASSAAATKLTTFDGYVLYYDLYVTVANGSTAMKNLKANATIQASGASDEVRNGVRVLVASDSAAEEFYNAHTEGGTATVAHTSGETVLASSIVSTALTHIKVYIYIDGEDSTIFTNNVTNLKEATISLSFTAEEDKSSTATPTVTFTQNDTVFTLATSNVSVTTPVYQVWMADDTNGTNACDYTTYFTVSGDTYTLDTSESKNIVGKYLSVRVYESDYSNVNDYKAASDWTIVTSYTDN